MAQRRLKALRSEPTLTARVGESVRDAIIDGQLAPGTLHSVQELAAAFGVSRTPVREALLMLERQGMVRFERNRGVRILQTSIHDLEEVVELRLLLEVPSTHRAAQQMTQATVSGLEREYARMERAAKGEDDAVFMRHDRRFHALIHECAGNKRLAEYVDGLRDLILMRGVITTRQSRTLADIVSEHRPILDSLRAGDPEGAAGAMKRHLVHTGQLMLAQEGGRAADAELPWADLAWPP